MDNAAPASEKIIRPKNPRTASARTIALLGPAFVAAVAYVDPGNVAANITAGARYGFLLVWVLVLANAMAVIVQYQSAKLGLVTHRSLPQALRDRLKRPWRIAYWLQAEIVAGATDIAEVIGGAIALHLLFGLPLLWGGIIIGAASMILLIVQGRGRQRWFELVVIMLLVVITVGFLAGLVVKPPTAGQILSGLVPRFEGQDSVLVAASMLGATVMPHAIYLHSTLVRHRHGDDHSQDSLRKLLHATRVDVVSALVLAGTVNIGLLLLAAVSLRDPSLPATDTIEGAHAAVVTMLGPTVGVVFAIGLLASGLASTSVGAYAGSEIMKGLLEIQVPLWLRRAITLIPALVILGMGVQPTWALVISQVVLSFGIPFAIIPLLLLTGNKKVMGEHRDNPVLRVVATIIAALIVALNLLLIVLTFMGQA